VELSGLCLRRREVARIVSHAFDLGDWKPQQMVMVSGRPIYLWIVGRPAERK